MTSRENGSLSVASRSAGSGVGLVASRRAEYARAAWLPALMLAAAVALMAMSCGDEGDDDDAADDDDASDTGETDSTNETDDAATACTGDRDCGDGERCEAGACVAATGDDDDATATTGDDDDATGVTGDDDDATATGDDDDVTGVDDDDDATQTGDDDDATATGDDDDDDTPPIVAPEWAASATCRSEIPDEATQVPEPLPEYDGECPVLVPGFNTISSGGGDREFLLILPDEPKEDEVLPVLFMWHWLKSKPESFAEIGEVQAAVDQQRFIAVIPKSLYDIADPFGLVEFPWPMVNFVSQARVDQELLFFDDMLACVAEQFAVNNQCISTVGVSAGALWSAELASARSGIISSLLSLSGGVASQGVSNNFLRPWISAAGHKYPSLVLWGGPQDSCVLVNFENASKELESRLEDESHFVLECVHNCKHAEPPIDAPPGKSRYSTLWDFFLNHPYWLPDGVSPYMLDGLPEDSIDWCSIGAGTAVPRTGACGEAACPI